MDSFAQFIPAVRRLARASHRKRIPIVQQVAWTDCGAACLAMVLCLHGRETRLEEVRRVLDTGRDGVDAAGLIAAAERHGMRGRGVRVAAGRVRELPRGAVLHWNLDHFVVLERVTRRGVEIVDPALGRRFLSFASFSESFTGVAILLEPSDAFESRRRGESRVRAYARPLLHNRLLLVRVIATSVLLRVLALGLPTVTALIVDEVVPRNDVRLLTVLAIGLAGIVAFQVVSELIRAHLLLQVRTVLDTRLTFGFLGHLVTLPFAFFQRRSTGDLMMRVASNATIRDTLTSSTLSALLDGPLVLVYLAVLSWVHESVALLTLALGLAQLGLFLVARRRVADLAAQGLEAQARTQGYLVQILGGMETLKVAGAEGRAVETWSNRFVDELNVVLERGRLQAAVDAAMTGLRSASPFVVLSYGAVLVIRGELSLGTMLAANALASGFILPLSSLVDGALRIQQLRGYVERIDDVLTTEPEQDPKRVSPAPTLTGHIAIRNLCFRYSNEAPDVLSDVNLDIAPGECVAIVGRSGSGKSTLASILLALQRPTAGEIFYDGARLRDIELGSLRRQMGMVVQHPYVFGQTVRENIAMGNRDVRLDDVVSAAKQASIHTEIVAMPMGYDTVVSDAGASLSGGQRQRIALARALVARPRVLVLDEATSALDTRTERTVMKSLSELQCVRIIIAHRLSTIGFADKIVIMERGRVADLGTHAELMRRCHTYRELVAAGEHGSAGLDEGVG